jgi:TetR/AcrR family transcriptional repressor of uid operon
MTTSLFLRATRTEDEPVQDDETRTRILDAAYALMLDFGMRRTTIEDIARRAGIGRPTLYRRFADKDAIVDAVIVRECRRSLRAVLAALTSVKTPEEQMTRGFVLATRTAARHPLIKRVLETEPDLLLPHLTSSAGAVIDMAQTRVTPFFRAYQKEGHFPGVDAGYAIEVLVGLFMSIVLTPSAKVSAHDDAKLEKLARGLLLPMLTGGAPAKARAPRRRARAQSA